MSSARRRGRALSMKPPSRECRTRTSSSGSSRAATSVWGNVAAGTVPAGMPIQTILVAYDDPESQTLGRAADYAEQLRATLIVTNVAPPKDSDPDSERLAPAGPAPGA